MHATLITSGDSADIRGPVIMRYKTGRLGLRP